MAFCCRHECVREIHPFFSHKIKNISVLDVLKDTFGIVYVSAPLPRKYSNKLYNNLQLHHDVTTMMQFFDYFIKKMLRNMTKKFLLLILTLIKHGITQMYASLSSLINISLIFILFYFFLIIDKNLMVTLKRRDFVFDSSDG